MLRSPIDVGKRAALAGLVLVGAACRSNSVGTAGTAAEAESRRVAVVNGEEVFALVPSQLKRDANAYRAFVKQIIYRTAVVQRAHREKIELTAAERDAVSAFLPSRAATQEYLRRQGQSYEAFANEAYDVALIQKMEHRDVFDAIVVNAAAVQRAFAASGVRGPRRFIIAMSLAGGCSNTGAAERLAEELRGAALPKNGHRLDTDKLSRAAGLPDQVWSMDLHLDGAGRPTALNAYDRSGAGRPVGPGLLDALAKWALASQPGELFAPRCIDGSLWLARQVGAAEARPLRLDEATDELEATLVAEQRKVAFDRYVDAVLTQTSAEILELPGQRL